MIEKIKVIPQGNGRAQLAVNGKLLPTSAVIVFSNKAEEINMKEILRHIRAISIFYKRNKTEYESSDY